MFTVLRELMRFDKNMFPLVGSNRQLPAFFSFPGCVESNKTESTCSFWKSMAEHLYWPKRFAKSIYLDIPSVPRNSLHLGSLYLCIASCSAG